MSRQGLPLGGVLIRYQTLMMVVSERLLAFVVLVGIVVSATSAARTLVEVDWGTTEAFYELIYRVLLLMVGLELMRMLVTHDLKRVLELLAFVIARKMLRPEITAMDIAISVLAFVALLAAQRYFPVSAGAS
jgi:hypothetical protein